MLQFATSTASSLSPASQVEGALEGGCRWIRLEAPDEDMAELAEAAIPPCRDRDAILIITSDVELVKRLRVHGVHLTPQSPMTPAQAREYLGPHAIIGCTVTSAEEVLALRHHDIDYVTADSALVHDISLEAAKAGNIIPIVAAGDIIPQSIVPILTLGASGVELSGTGSTISGVAAAVSSALSQIEEYCAQ